ncbi:LytTR family transcriptional regulator [Bacteroides sp. OttesenSCG-928-D19]|nr:LytTR family transcriptional regulator [Bacteroides sp. OttesenSCG-928-N06]MDL2304936.1 LytTR family transcriptional regulator [Bacteroides sp. OttesenSCG-928-D19]
MHKHPFTETPQRKIGILLTGGLAIFLFAALMHLYGNIPLSNAITDSTLSMVVLFMLGYIFWFIVDAIQIPQAEFILSIGVLVIWLSCCLVIQLANLPVNDNFFAQYLFLLPLRLGIATLLWLALILWYRTIKLNRWKEDKQLTEVVQAQNDETLDRIAVKSGSHIHVIPIKELIHVQACGDYVMLFTTNGEFLKEQTMKSLELHLPNNFVRIHRSFIVNIEYIGQVELYGKETYHVHLKNGTTLRASISGYKLLKEVLEL